MDFCAHPSAVRIQLDSEHHLVDASKERRTVLPLGPVVLSIAAPIYRYPARYHSGKSLQSQLRPPPSTTED